LRGRPPPTQIKRPWNNTNSFGLDGGPAELRVDG